MGTRNDKILARRVAAKFAARPIPIDKNQARKLTKKAVQVLQKWLNSIQPEQRGETLKNLRQGSRTFRVGAYRTTDVRGESVVVGFLLGAARGGSGPGGPRYYIAGGHVTVGLEVDSKNKPIDYGKKIKMLVNVDTRRTPQELLDNLDKVEREIFSVLIHEVTHLRDLLVFDGYAEDGQPKSLTPEQYHNKPSEVRAFMQQIVDEVLEYADDVGRNTEGFGLYLDSDFVDNALEDSAMWRRIVKGLNPRNRKLIMKAVARALTDAMPKLQEKYPAEDWDDDDY